MNKCILIALIYVTEPAHALFAQVKELCAHGLRVVIATCKSEYPNVCKLLEDSADIICLSETPCRADAIRAGVVFARKRYASCILITVDEKGAHRTFDVLRAIGIARKNPGKLILGVRKRRRGKFLAFLLRTAYRVFGKLNVRDLTTGLRAFDDSLFDLMLDTPGAGEDYEINLLLRAAKEKIPIFETDIETISPEGGACSLYSAFRHYVRTFAGFMKFSLSSLAGFVTDYAAFNILYAIAIGMGDARLVFANYAARALSATVNYLINRRFVFKSDAGVFKTAVQYFALAAVISVGNTYLLTFLTGGLRMNAQIAKLLTEIAFFATSFTVQRFVIFRKKKAVS